MALSITEVTSRRNERVAVQRLYMPHFAATVAFALPPILLSVMSGRRVWTRAGMGRPWTIAIGAIIVLLTSYCQRGVIGAAVPPVPAALAPELSRTLVPGLVALSADGSKAAAADYSNNRLQVLDVSEGSPPIRLTPVDCKMRGNPAGLVDRQLPGAFSPDGTLWAQPCWGYEKFAVWNKIGGKEAYVSGCPVPKDKVDSEYYDMIRLAWSPDSKLLAGGCSEGRVIVWEASTGKEVANFFIGENHRWDDWVMVQFTSDGQIMSFVISSRQVTFSEVSGRKLRSIHFPQKLSRVAPIPGGKELLVVYGMSSPLSGVEIWNAETGARRKINGIQAGNPVPMAFSPDGSLVVLGFSESTTAVFSLAKDRYVKTLSQNERIVDLNFRSNAIIGITNDSIATWQCCK